VSIAAPATGEECQGAKHLKAIVATARKINTMICGDIFSQCMQQLVA